MVEKIFLDKYVAKEIGEAVEIPDGFATSYVWAVMSRGGQMVTILNPRTWCELYSPRSFEAKWCLYSATLKKDLVNHALVIDHSISDRLGEGPFMVEYRRNRIVLRAMTSTELSAYFNYLVLSYPLQPSNL